MSLAFQLAWRFRASKRKNGFISFISASSTMGIGLGCCVLIVLLSVMNGFERELKDQLLAVIPHGEIWSVNNRGILGWETEIAQLQADPRLRHIEPYVKATGMLQKGASMKAAEVIGLHPDYLVGASIASKVSPGALDVFRNQDDAILLGEGVMRALGASIGDKIQILLPQLSEDLALRPPKSLWLTVVGKLEVSGELGNHTGVMRMQTAASALGIESGAQGLRFQFDDPFVAPYGMREIGYAFSQHVYMSDWTRTQGHLYQDIQLVRTVVYLALTLVIAVACFNIVSTLVMAVNEKQSEIAMLKTMGARDSLITRVFILQGVINGVTGSVIGVTAGVLLSLNLSDVALFFEHIFGFKFLSGDIYFIDFLPSELHWQEVAITAVIALLLSLLATLYPARKAARINPATALGQ